MTTACRLPGCDPALTAVPSGFIVTAQHAAKLIALNGTHVAISAPGPDLVDVDRPRGFSRGPGLDAARPMEHVHGLAAFTPETFGYTADDLTPYPS